MRRSIRRLLARDPLLVHRSLESEHPSLRRTLDYDTDVAVREQRALERAWRS